ncbi:fimbrial protein [Proteus myxofaciens]|uniref:Putative fimbrial-like protein n=1 Tax=Proteus myxofaciens ATCC 19692 TaxID=1354337 RepID=A0A198GD66_9GAMM|nr:fimbrial protein [Proteus myxofaciens]OAT34729.1 putative fimbrial-like protein [Proteus myxofaciens ATCC 19692]
MTFKKIALTTALFAAVSGMSVNANADASSEVTLQGIITNTTCTVTVNGGKSVLNLGVQKASDFVANTKLGDIEMPVTLSNCSADDGETGQLIIQGLTSVKNNDKNLFVSDDNNSVGFMITPEGSTTAIKNGEGAQLAVAQGETGATYNFKVGMASTTAAPATGSYSAPILVAYIVQ